MTEHEWSGLLALALCLGCPWAALIIMQIRERRRARRLRHHRRTK